MLSDREKLELEAQIKADINARRGLLYDNAIRSLNPLNEGFLAPNSSGVNTVNMNLENLPIVGNTETLIADELPGRELVDQNNARSQALLNELPSNLTPEEITARLNLNSGQTKEYDPSQTYRMQGLFEGGDANVPPIQQRAMAPSIVSRSIEAEEEKYGPGGKFSATPLPGGIYDRSGTGVTNFSMSQNPVFTRGNESTNISPTNTYSLKNERKKIDQKARLLSGIAAVFGGNPRAADIYRKNRSAVIDQLAAQQGILGTPEGGYQSKVAATVDLTSKGLTIDQVTRLAPLLTNKAGGERLGSAFMQSFEKRIALEEEVLGRPLTPPERVEIFDTLRITKTENVTSNVAISDDKKDEILDANLDASENIIQVGSILKLNNKELDDLTGFRGEYLGPLAGIVAQTGLSEDSVFNVMGSTLDAEQYYVGRNTLNTLLPAFIKVYTGEDSGRYTDTEQRIAKDMSAIGSLDATPEKLRAVLTSVVVLDIMKQMRAGELLGQPPYDLTLDENNRPVNREEVKKLITYLKKQGFEKDEILAQSPKITNYFNEMKRVTRTDNLKLHVISEDAIEAERNQLK